MSERINFREKVVRGAKVVGAAGGLSLLAACQNPFANSHQKAIAELYKDANKDCAAKAVTTEEGTLTPSVIAEATSLKDLTTKANTDASAMVDACVATETGIPHGTAGFVNAYPTIAISATVGRA